MVRHLLPDTLSDLYRKSMCHFLSWVHQIAIHFQFPRARALLLYFFRHAGWRQLLLLIISTNDILTSQVQSHCYSKVVCLQNLNEWRILLGTSVNSGCFANTCAASSFLQEWNFFIFNSTIWLFRLGNFFWKTWEFSNMIPSLLALTLLEKSQHDFMAVAYISMPDSSRP